MTDNNEELRLSIPPSTTIRLALKTQTRSELVRNLQDQFAVARIAWTRAEADLASVKQRIEDLQEASESDRRPDELRRAWDKAHHLIRQIGDHKVECERVAMLMEALELEV
jgi:hypothetical protein